MCFSFNFIKKNMTPTTDDLNRNEKREIFVVTIQTTNKRR